MQEIVAQCGVDLPRLEIYSARHPEAKGRCEQPLRSINATNTALKILVESVPSRAMATIERDFADEPLVRAAVQQTVAQHGTRQPSGRRSGRPGRFVLNPRVTFRAGVLATGSD